MKLGAFLASASSFMVKPLTLFAFAMLGLRVLLVMSLLAMLITMGGYVEGMVCVLRTSATVNRVMSIHSA